MSHSSTGPARAGVFVDESALAGSADGTDGTDGTGGAAGAGGTLAITASRGGPPREVLEQIAVAIGIEERLRAAGRRLRFHAAERGERMRIEFHDCDGAVVRTVSAVEAVEVAAGKPLE
jgi:hypothetical protein